jgi:hypothetical protein
MGTVCGIDYWRNNDSTIALDFGLISGVLENANRASSHFSQAWQGCFGALEAF